MKKDAERLNVLKNCKFDKVKALIAIILLFTIFAVLILIPRGEEEELTYRETSVQYGSLTVGIRESSTVDIGTVEQVFELDISAIQRTSTGDSSDSSSGMGTSGMNGMGNGGGSMMGNMGGTDMFSQIFGMAEGNNYTNSEDSIGLTIAEVYVSVGQQVEEGEPLYRLEEENVEKLREQLSSDVEKAKADLEAVYADQILSRQTAEYTYESSMAYGDYANTEYQATISELQDAVAAKETALETAKSSLNNYEEQLAEAEKLYEEALTVLKNSIWSRDNENKKENTYSYVTYFQTAQEAQSIVDNFEQKIEQLEKNIEQAKQNVETYTKELNEAKRSLEQGRLSAAQTLSLRTLAYSSAQETYDIALSYLEEDAREQEETYAEAQGKWEEFSTHIHENTVKAAYSGVITSVELEKGDTVNTNDTLVTLYDMEEVTMTATVEEGDMADIVLGGEANVSFTAYPEEVFKAEVTEISDASTDSNGNVTYEVTITLSGDVSGLFQGMTGDITFITKEVREVLYVSNRAVIRQGSKSYIKLRDEEGNVRKQEIITGFSDGIHVEILEGLNAGDIVLIESKVSE